MQQPSPQVRVIPERADYLNFVTYQDRTVFARRFWSLLLAVPLFLFALVTYEIWSLGGIVATLRADPAAITVPAVAILWVVAHSRATARKARKLAMREPVGEQTFRVESDGLAVDNGSRRFKYAWRDLVDVVETNGMLLFVHKRERGAFKATMVPLASARGDAQLFRSQALANFRGARLG